MIDGHVHLGEFGTGGEVGHQIVVPDGPLCGCGNHGCVEALARADTLAALAGQPDVATVYRRAADGDETCLAAINTVVGLDVDLETGRPVLPRRFGGFSGLGIRPIALAKVDEIVREVGLPVVGIGGIDTAEDALKFFALGCVAVQVGTASFVTPSASTDIVSELSNWLSDRNISSVRELIGGLEVPPRG